MDYRVPRSADDADIDIVDVVRPLECALEDVDPQEAREIFAAATPGQRILYAYNLYFYEVENGGHEQFFSNPSGPIWRDVLDAVQQFGLKADEEIYRAALGAFPGGAPADDQATREAQVEAVESAFWSELNRRFYNEPSHRSGSGTEIDDYIRRHPHEFFLP